MVLRLLSKPCFTTAQPNHCLAQLLPSLMLVRAQTVDSFLRFSYMYTHEAYESGYQLRRLAVGTFEHQMPAVDFLQVSPSITILG